MFLFYMFLSNFLLFYKVNYFVVSEFLFFSLKTDLFILKMISRIYVDNDTL